MADRAYKKRWGQHHLRRAESCAPLVEFLRPAGRCVVEIGPGGGVLTRALLAAGARVLAWEIDPAWALSLRRSPGLSPVVGDALELPWGRLPAGVLVAGNLPYNVATPLIDRMLDGVGELGAAAFMVQWEVGERLTAGPGDAGYGASSLLTAARAGADLLGRVPKGAFRPPPKVDGALIGLTPRRRVRADRYPAFRAVVWQAFAERRKTVRNSLASGWGRRAADAVLAAAAVDPTARAERLGLEAFVGVARIAVQLGVLTADGTIADIRRTGS